MCADVGQQFSLARLLEPLPANCAGTFFDVLAHVDAALAPPLLRILLGQQGQGQFDVKVVENVVWKLNVLALHGRAAIPACVFDSTSQGATRTRSRRYDSSNPSSRRNVPAMR